VLYVGIIAAIQEHAHDHCCGRVSRHVYIYPNPLGHTLESFASLEYEFNMRSKREGTPKVVGGSIGMVPLYHEWFRNCPKPYRWYKGRVGTKLGQTGLFMESPEYVGRSNLRGGPPWVWGQPLAGRITKRWIPSQGLPSYGRKGRSSGRNLNPTSTRPRVKGFAAKKTKKFIWRWTRTSQDLIYEMQNNERERLDLYTLIDCTAERFR
jgi:hypothetical protein